MGTVKNQSFTKIEHELIHAFREQINLAESMTDVKRVFSHTAQQLLLKVFNNRVDVKVDDVSLTPGQEPGYALNETLLCNDAFKELWSISDLRQIIERFAFSAAHRYKQLQKHHDDGTASKIGRH